MEQELADAPEEADDVRVAQRIAFLVAHGFEELVDPDGGVDGEALLVEGRELDGAGAGGEDGPEALDAHSWTVERRWWLRGVTVGGGVWPNWGG